MRCKFCFARFQDVKNSILPAGHLPKEQAVAIVKQVAEAGFKKITFAGGEPLLCPWLPELIRIAKRLGLTTMIVTNGSLLNDEFLLANRNYLDWIAISSDSLNQATNIALGRALGSTKPLSMEHYLTIVRKAKERGYGLKINTVVTSLNQNEDLSEFINLAKPERWKIMQVLPILGQNDAHIANLEISNSQFQDYLNRNSYVDSEIRVVSEYCNQMTGSYVMIDPAGRLFDNSNSKHNYSDPILQCGIYEALKQVNYDSEKFNLRGGVYQWERKNVINYKF
jgi:radical S-adenosyl methionine domain-containing protein 2